jgi:hypothetical protein
MAEHAPAVGDWYQRLDNGSEFLVTAVDEARGFVAVQDADGEIAQLDLSSWDELELQPVAARLDWSNALDELQPDDFGYGESDSPSAGGPTPDGIEERRFVQPSDEEE